MIAQASKRQKLSPGVFQLDLVIHEHDGDESRQVTIQPDNQSLFVTGCNIVSIGPSLATWGSVLKTLILTENRFQELPDVFAALTNLQELRVDWNPYLTALPRSLGTLLHLRVLDLGFSGINTLPNWLPVSLERLNCTNCRLMELPESIGGLTRLASLSIQHNPLTRFPASFTKLNGLSDLRCSGTALSELSPVFCNLTALNSLTIDAKVVHALPLEVARSLSQTLHKFVVHGLNKETKNGFHVLDRNNCRRWLPLRLWHPLFPVPVDQTAPDHTAERAAWLIRYLMLALDCDVPIVELLVPNYAQTRFEF